jgi:hypothetical protein
MLQLVSLLPKAQMLLSALDVEIPRLRIAGMPHRNRSMVELLGPSSASIYLQSANEFPAVCAFLHVALFNSAPRSNSATTVLNLSTLADCQVS